MDNILSSAKEPLGEFRKEGALKILKTGLLTYLYLFSILEDFPGMEKALVDTAMDMLREEGYAVDGYKEIAATYKVALAAGPILAETAITTLFEERLWGVSIIDIPEHQRGVS